MLPPTSPRLVPQMTVARNNSTVSHENQGRDGYILSTENATKWYLQLNIVTKCADIKKSILADGDTEQSRTPSETRLERLLGWLIQQTHETVSV